MIIRLKNKDTLAVDEFHLKCCIGKKGLSSNKIEGDLTTPRGLFGIETLYFRKDRVEKTKCRIKKRIITKKIGWCDDSNHKKYNEEIRVFANDGNTEKFYRRDHKYDYLITITHNNKKIPHKGSAIFIHLTDNYNPTAGCIALKKKDFEIILKLIDNKTTIKLG